MLGLIIGISSVVTIVSLGNGTQQMMVENFEALGINKITIYTTKGATLSPSERLHIDDVENIKEGFPNIVTSVIPNVSRNAEVLENIDDTDISIKGVTEDSEDSLDLDMIMGRFLNSYDMTSKKSFIVIPSDLADQFAFTDPIGESIMISSGRIQRSFTIVGVYQPLETMGGFSNPSVYLPYTTLDKLFKTEGLLQSIEVSFAEDVDKTLQTSRVIQTVERHHKNTGEDKYQSFSPEQSMAIVSESLSMVTLFISAIAAISLVVGGIGIMNIMLVSVTERTREIGIRKALGARHFDILMQFLIEAVTVSIFGGILGVGLGWILTHIASNLMATPAVIALDSVLIAVSFSATIGIFFGIYPANKAAMLDPIEALRYE